MNDLYQQYGELMIQAEILQAKLTSVKKQIVDAINKQESERETGHGTGLHTEG